MSNRSKNTGLAIRVMPPFVCVLMWLTVVRAGPQDESNPATILTDAYAKLERGIALGHGATRAIADGNQARGNEEDQVSRRVLEHQEARQQEETPSQHTRPAAPETTTLRVPQVKARRFVNLVEALRPDGDGDFDWQSLDSIENLLVDIYAPHTESIHERLVVRIEPPGDVDPVLFLTSAAAFHKAVGRVSMACNALQAARRQVDSRRDSQVYLYLFLAETRYRMLSDPWSPDTYTVARDLLSWLGQSNDPATFRPLAPRTLATWILESRQGYLGFEYDTVIKSLSSRGDHANARSLASSRELYESAEARWHSDPAAAVDYLRVSLGPGTPAIRSHAALMAIVTMIAWGDPDAGSFVSVCPLPQSGFVRSLPEAVSPNPFVRGTPSGHFTRERFLDATRMLALIAGQSTTTANSNGSSWEHSTGSYSPITVAPGTRSTIDLSDPQYGVIPNYDAVDGMLNSTLMDLMWK